MDLLERIRLFNKFNSEQKEAMQNQEELQAKLKAVNTAEEYEKLMMDIQNTKNSVGFLNMKLDDLKEELKKDNTRHRYNMNILEEHNKKRAELERKIETAKLNFIATIEDIVEKGNEELRSIQKKSNYGEIVATYREIGIDLYYAPYEKLRYNSIMEKMKLKKL